MSQSLTTDEIRNELVEVEKWLSNMLRLLDIKLEGGRYVSANGEPYGLDKRDAIQQEAVRTHELIRLRRRIWQSEFEEELKISLVNLLNLTARFIDMVLLEDASQEDLTQCAERAAWLFGALSNVPVMERK